jgi:hypothetical protein
VLRRYTWSQCKSDRSRIEAVVGHRRASGASTDTCDPTSTSFFSNRFITYVSLILNLDAICSRGVSVAVRYLINAANNSIVVAAALRIGFKVYVTGRPVLRLGQLSLRTIIVELLCPSSVAKFYTLAAG